MPLAAALSVLSFVLASSVAAFALRVSRAPGWRDQREFAVAALALAAYSALNLPTTLCMSDVAVVVTSRLQLLCVAAHTIGWQRFTCASMGVRCSRAERALAAAAVVLAVAGALTPAAFPGGAFTISALGVLRYRSASCTWVATGAVAFALAAVTVTAWRLGQAARRGMPDAGLRCASLTCFLLAGVNDGLVMSGAYAGPFLIELAFALPTAAIGYATAARLVSDATALAALRDDLAREVRSRTAELGAAQEQLLRSEKLAALGQFAAGIAHEVNNPTAVVQANLAWVLEEDAWGEEARDALEEALVSARRIADIVRQLLGSGRLAAAVERPRAVAVRDVVADAVRAARARFGDRVDVRNEVAAGLHASAEPGVLLQVLSNLVANAVQSIPESRTGQVVVRASSEATRVRVVVEDDGAGMPPEVLRRVFEPFFTTKPVGSGTGLGLAVSRGLVLGLGGDLRLESEQGRGTRATLELPRAVPASCAGELAAGPACAGGPGARLLVVDDDPAVRAALARLLRQRHHVELAGSVAEALARLRAACFDAVLCDVMMPDGGAESLLRALEARCPGAAARVVLVTAGASSEHARRFVAAHPAPVLHKPFGLEDVAAALERVRARCGEPRLA